MHRWRFLYTTYQKVLFLKISISLYLPYSPLIKDQGETKEEPRNDLRTPNHPKVLFIKIAVSFTSLIPCLILPREERETTDRTPTQLPTHKKCCFLRLLPNKVVLIPKKVDSFPKTVDYIPKIVAYPPNKKSPQNCIFLAQFKIIHYLCTRNKKYQQWKRNHLSNG